MTSAGAPNGSPVESTVHTSSPQEGGGGRSEATPGHAATAFESVVLSWLHEDGVAADAVEVRPFGTDWDGDTEGGFYSSFCVDLRYWDSSGKTHRRTVAGDDMESLWMHVVHSVDLRRQ